MLVRVVLLPIGPFAIIRQVNRREIDARYCTGETQYFMHTLMTIEPQRNNSRIVIPKPEVVLWHDDGWNERDFGRPELHVLKLMSYPPRAETGRIMRQAGIRREDRHAICVPRRVRPSRPTWR